MMTRMLVGPEPLPVEVLVPQRREDLVMVNELVGLAQGFVAKTEKKQAVAGPAAEQTGSCSCGG